jgi:hypothetical protein
MNKGKNMMKNVEMETKELVLARLTTLPPDRKIFIGSHGEFSKDEMIESVEKWDKVGQKFVQIQMEYLRALAEGITV